MFFINFLLMLLPALSIAPFPPATPADPAQYCNDRFSYCLTYPDEYFTQVMSSDNGDGIMLTNEEGTVKVSVTGAYNVMNWTVEEINDIYFESLENKPMEVRLSEILTEDTYGWVEMRYNYEIQLFKVNLLNDAYVTMLITVPASQAELLEELTEKLQLSFPM